MSTVLSSDLRVSIGSRSYVQQLHFARLGLVGLFPLLGHYKSFEHPVVTDGFGFNTRVTRFYSIFTSLLILLISCISVASSIWSC